MPLTHQIRNAQIPDLGELNRFVLDLPLSEGVTRADVIALIGRDESAAKIVLEMREELQPLLDLTEGWMGWKGAILSARRKGTVSEDFRWQRAWEFHLTRSPQTKRRTDLATKWLGREKKLGPFLHPALSSALVLCGFALFFVAGRWSVPFSTTNEGLKPGNDGPKSVPLKGGATPNDTLEKMLNPDDDHVAEIVVRWEKRSMDRPNDASIHLKISELYSRLLKLPSAKMEKLGMGEEEIAYYKNCKAVHDEWLLNNKFTGHPRTP